MAPEDTPQGRRNPAQRKAVVVATLWFLAALAVVFVDPGDGNQPETLRALVFWLTPYAAVVVSAYLMAARLASKTRRTWVRGLVFVAWCVFAAGLALVEWVVWYAHMMSTW